MKLGHIFSFLAVFIATLAYSQLPDIALDIDIFNSALFYESTPYNAEEINWPTTGSDRIEPGFYYDRYGNNIPNSIIYRDAPSVGLATKNETREGVKAVVVEAGYFVLHFADDPLGFEDPFEGAARRAVVEQVCDEISDMLPEPPIDVCTGEPAQVHLLLNGGDPLPDGVLGGATAAYDTRFGDQQILDGEVWKVLITGNASDEKIHHGFIEINFDDYRWDTEQDPNTLEYDLYTVIFHELLHTMGFVSLIGPDGQSNFQSIGRTFFSRYDMLLQLNGADVIAGSIPEHNLNSTLDANTVTARCSNLRISPERGCGFLQEDHGIFAPNTFQQGSSMSHVERCGETDKPRYLMSWSLERGVEEELTQPEIEILAELGYQIQGSGNNTALGGVNDDFTCEGRTRYQVESCEGATLTIPVTNNDGVEPDNITGVRVLGGSGATAVASGSDIVFTPDPNDFGFVVVQYVPVYGCFFGNVSEVLVYSLPCGDQSCFSNSDPQCITNCNGDFEEASRSEFTRCRRVGSITNGGNLNVQQWGNMSAGTGSPDYYSLGNGNHGMAILPDEGLVHRVSLRQGRNYLINIVAGNFPDRRAICYQEQSRDNGPVDFLRLVGFEGAYTPYGNRQYFDKVDAYVFGLDGNIEVISDIPGEGIELNNLTNIQLCFSPAHDYDEVLIYYSTPEESSNWYLLFDEFTIRELPFQVNDQTIACGGNPVSIQQSDACDFESVLNFNWRDEAGNILSYGLGTDHITSSGTYSFNGVLANGEICFSEEFEVVSTGSNFDINATITEVTCDNPGRIDITIVGGTPSASYTFQWSNGESTDFIETNEPGNYSVTIFDGDCFLTRSFNVPGLTRVELQIFPDQEVLDFCDGNEVELSANEEVDWYFNNNPDPVATNTARYTAIQEGTYSVGKANTQTICYVEDVITLDVKFIENNALTADACESGASAVGTVLNGEAAYTSWGAGTISYQWQRSNDGGQNYEDIPGQAGTNEDYTITALDVLNNFTCFRRLALADDCEDISNVFCNGENNAGFWPATASSDLLSAALDSEQDEDGNFYVLGTFATEIIFDARTITAEYGGSGSGLFVARYNPCGSLDWVSTITGSSGSAKYPPELKLNASSVFILGNIGGSHGQLKVTDDANTTTWLNDVWSNYIIRFDLNTGTTSGAHSFSRSDVPGTPIGSGYGQGISMRSSDVDEENIFFTTDFGIYKTGLDFSIEQWVPSTLPSHIDVTADGNQSLFATMWSYTGNKEYNGTVISSQDQELLIIRINKQDLTEMNYQTYELDFSSFGLLFNKISNHVVVNETQEDLYVGGSASGAMFGELNSMDRTAFLAKLDPVDLSLDQVILPFNEPNMYITDLDMDPSGVYISSAKRASNGFADFGSGSVVKKYAQNGSLDQLLFESSTSNGVVYSIAVRPPESTFFGGSEAAGPIYFSGEFQNEFDFNSATLTTNSSFNREFFAHQIPLEGSSEMVASSAQEAQEGITSVVESEMMQLSIYPNPASDKIYISGSKEIESGSKIQFISQLGQVVKTHKCTEDKREIIILSDGLTSGIYLLRIIQPDGVSLTEKIQISKP